MSFCPPPYLYCYLSVTGTRKIAWVLMAGLRGSCHGSIILSRGWVSLWRPLDIPGTIFHTARCSFKCRLQTTDSLYIVYV